MNKRKDISAEKAMDKVLKDLKEGKAISLGELQAAGVILAVDRDFGRVANKPHLKKLKTSLKRDGCIEPVSVFLGSEYFREYPERELTGLNDEEKRYTRDSPELPGIIFVADGLHRTLAHLELLSEGGDYRHPLEFRHVETHLPIDRWTHIRNSHNRNWDSKDCSRHIAARTGYGKSNLTTAVKWQEELKLGERYSYMILNLSDTYRKRMLSEYMDDPGKGLPAVLKGSAENIDRGGRILRAFRVCWRGIPRMVRNSASINMFIRVYNACGDGMKEVVVDALVLFFTTLDKTDAETVAGERDNEGKIRLLTDYWNKFSKEIADEGLKVDYERRASEAGREFDGMSGKKEETADSGSTGTGSGKGTRYHGKAIYQPGGKAGEYGEWACNFHKGCGNRCSYCYLQKGRGAGNYTSVPALKSCFKDGDDAMERFGKELLAHLPELRGHGLFFSFTTDPLLPETMELTAGAVRICMENGVNVKLLTKRADFVEPFFKYLSAGGNCDEEFCKGHVAFGFTLTGRDDLEPSASPNAERVRTMRLLHGRGHRIFVSAEPVIDPEASLEMIRETLECCDLYKVGLLSGERAYGRTEIRNLVEGLKKLPGQPRIYLKDSVVNMLRLDRSVLPKNFVKSDYNMFN